MSEDTIDSGTNSKAPAAAPKRTRKAAKKAKAVKTASRGKKSRQEADRANKKAAVIAMLNLPEVVGGRYSSSTWMSGAR